MIKLLLLLLTTTIGVFSGVTISGFDLIPDESRLWQEEFAVRLMVNFSEDVSDSFNVSIRFPNSTFDHPISGTAITSLIDSYQCCLRITSSWDDDTLFIETDDEFGNVTVSYLFLEIQNFSSPSSFGDYGEYRLQLTTWNNITGTYISPFAHINPESDNIFGSRTATYSNSLLPTDTLSITSSLTATDSFSLTETDSVSLSLRPPTPTFWRTPTFTATASELEDLPCFCFGRGNCFIHTENTADARQDRRCVCEEGYTGRFCQIAICGSKQCGEWGLCTITNNIINRTTTSLHESGNAGRADPNWSPVRWMSTVDSNSGDVKTAKQDWMPLRNNSYISSKYSFTSAAGVDAFGWFHLCPDNEHTEELDLSDLALTDITGGVLQESPFHCILLEISPSPFIGQVQSQIVSLDSEHFGPISSYNISCGWIGEHAFFVTANATGVHENQELNLTFSEDPAFNIRHVPFGESKQKTRLLYIADYASDSDTRGGVKDIEIVIDIDARRLSKSDLYFTSYGHRKGSTPHKFVVTASYTTDSSRKTRFISHTIVPGYLADWLPYCKESTMKSSRVSYFGDNEITMGAPLLSHHLFIIFGGDGTPESTVEYAAANLFTVKEFKCQCVSNTTAGIAYIDQSDPYCQRCQQYHPMGRYAFPVGDCTRPCKCRFGQCDPVGRCICPKQYRGVECELCESNWYPAQNCSTFCNGFTTCLGRGECNGLGKCQCKPGFKGPRCEERTCFSSEIQCNGIGSCRSGTLSASEYFGTLTSLEENHPDYWGKPNKPTLHPNNDDTKIATHGIWLNGPGDTFDGFGNISICTTHKLCLQIPLQHGIKLSPISIGTSTAIVWSGTLLKDDSLIIINIENDSGPPVWIEFGGKLAGPYIAQDILSNLDTGGRPTCPTATRVLRQHKSVSQDIAFSVSHPIGNARSSDVFSVTVDQDTSNAEHIKTPEVESGTGTPLTLVIYRSDSISEDYAEQLFLFTFKIASQTQSAYCQDCGRFGGNWCETCHLRQFPFPQCDQTCGCAGSETCDLSGKCICYGNRAGDLCETCIDDYFNWPDCDRYCHELFTCSGNGICTPLGQCECFAGNRGRYCDIAACTSSSCGAKFNGGSGTCSNPSNSFYRLLWEVGIWDSSNKEFGLPLLRAAAQGPFFGNVTMTRQSIPSAIAGVNLSSQTGEGLDANEFNPMSLGFVLPEKSSHGYCWLVSTDGIGQYVTHQSTPSSCQNIGGRWESSSLCFHKQNQSFTQAPCHGDATKSDAFSETQSNFFLILKFIPPIAEVHVVISVNGIVMATKTKKFLDTEIEIPYKTLLWGEYNVLKIEIADGGELKLDYFSLECTTTAHVQMASLSQVIQPDFSKGVNMNENLAIAADLRHESSTGVSYFAEGPGLLKTNNGFESKKTFDRYGKLRICLNETAACSDIQLSARNQTTVWPLSLSGVKFVLTSVMKFGIFQIFINESRSSDKANRFSVSLGGNYSYSAEPRSSEIRYQPFIFKRQKSVISVVINSARGLVDAFSGGMSQVHLAVVPFHISDTDFATFNKSTINHYEGVKHYKTEERIIVENLVNGATIFLQWGFTPYVSFMRYVYDIMQTASSQLCMCSQPFSGPTCTDCSYVACDIPQCANINLCRKCIYPSTGLDCNDCLPGYEMISGTCIARCPSVHECSQRGICVLPEVCNCYPGYFSDNCQTKAGCLFECIGPGYTECEMTKCLVADEPGMHISVALCPYPCANGICNRQSRKCQCDHGWDGSDCTVPVCAGGRTCYGHGFCSEPSVCICSDGWTGINCESSICGIYKTCDSCINSHGCGWCSVTNECLPGDYSTGAYSPTGSPKHVCSAPNHGISQLYKKIFKLKNCIIGFSTIHPLERLRMLTTTDRGMETVNFVNCSKISELGFNNSLYYDCLQLSLDNDDGDDEVKRRGRKLMAVTTTNTMTSSDTTTFSTSESIYIKTATIPVLDPVVVCNQQWGQWNWMTTDLTSNYQCACVLEAQYSRDEMGSCLQESMLMYFSDSNIITELIQQQARDSNSEYVSRTTRLSQLKKCCDEGDPCCNNTEVAIYERKVQETVEWYITNMVPYHKAAYNQARSQCGCDPTCVNHQRDSIWKFLAQYRAPCVLGSLANVLLHPCKVSGGQVVASQLPSPYVAAPCPISSFVMKVTLEQSVLPSCDQWISPEAKLCCSSVFKCYQDCEIPVANCNTEFLSCIATTFRCVAFLGVQQLVDEVSEVSSDRLFQSLYSTLRLDSSIRRQSCPCSDRVTTCYNGLLLPDLKCLCFENWSTDRFGKCRIPICPMECSKNGFCGRNEHNLAVCFCNRKWIGEKCDIPVWANFSIHGLGHLTTWDGLQIVHHGEGAYLLAEGSLQSDSDQKFTVQVSKRYFHNIKRSVADSIIIAVGSSSVKIWSKLPNEVCIGTQKPQCLMGRVQITVNNEPFLPNSDEYSWRYKRFMSSDGNEVVVYAVPGFTDIVFFIEIVGILRSKIGIVWSNELQYYYFNVLLQIRLPSFSDIAGLAGSPDGNPFNDIVSEISGRVFKHIWADYHDLGELYKLHQSLLPLRIESVSRVSVEGYLPEATIVMECNHITNSDHRLSCQQDFVVLNDSSVTASEYILSFQYCNSHPRDCLYSGYCVPPPTDSGSAVGYCKCPQELNSSESCSLSFNSDFHQIPEYDQSDHFFQSECFDLDDCNGHGECTNGECSCDQMWKDELCSTPICLESCVNGECFFDMNQWVVAVSHHTKFSDPYCKCYPGYGGSRCESVSLCPSLRECTGHGLCTDDTHCICYSGWYGSYCENQETSICRTSMAGKWCIEPNCNCNGHGFCSIETGTAQCICDKNWYTNNCNIPCIPEVTCSGHGECTVMGVCQCVSPFRTQTCDVVNPVAPPTYVVSIPSKPPFHQQGLQLNLNAVINNVPQLPSGTYTFKWNSQPSGLFDSISEVQMSVLLAGNAFRCPEPAPNGQESIDAILTTCSYFIQATLYNGIVAVAKDGFLLQIKEAPRYVSGATVTTSECRIESVMAMCYLQETTTMVTLNAGLWMDHNPPLLYRYEYVIVTSSGQTTSLPINNKRTFGYTSEPVANFSAPVLPCSVTDSNATIQFLVFVQNAHGAVIVRVMSSEVEFRLQKQSDSTTEMEILPMLYQQLQAGTLLGVDCALSTVFLSQRLKPAFWNWEFIVAVFDDLYQILQELQQASNKNYAMLLLDGLVQMNIMAKQPFALPSCGRSVSPPSPVLSDLYQNRTNYLWIAINKITKSEMDQVQDSLLSTEIASALIETSLKKSSYSERLSFLEEVLMRVPSSMKTPSTDVRVTPRLQSQTSYILQDTTLYPSANFPTKALGGDFIMASYDPGADRSFTIQGVDGKTHTLLLESTIISISVRDQTTKVPINVASMNTSEPIATIMFSLSSDINYRRSYNCVYWEDSTWLWGDWVGVGRIESASRLDPLIMPAGLRQTSYGCQITHFSIFALAFMEELIPVVVVDDSTPMPSSTDFVLPPEEPVILSGERVSGVSSTQSTTIIISISVFAGAVLAAFSIKKYLRYRKESAFDEDESPTPGNSHASRIWRSRSRTSSIRKSQMPPDAVGKVKKAIRFGSYNENTGERRKSKRGIIRHHLATKELLAQMRGQQQLHIKTHTGPLPPPPEDATEDEYLAQRNIEVIEQVIDINKLSEFNPTNPVGTKRFVYWMEGDDDDERPCTAPTNEQLVSPSASTLKQESPGETAFESNVVLKAETTPQSN